MFKPGDKVVCVKISETVLYNFKNITIGKNYIIEHVYSKDWGSDGSLWLRLSKDDSGDGQNYRCEDFISLEEYNFKNKIAKIIE